MTHAGQIFFCVKKVSFKEEIHVNIWTAPGQIFKLSFASEAFLLDGGYVLEIVCFDIIPNFRGLEESLERQDQDHDAHWHHETQDHGLYHIVLPLKHDRNDVGGENECHSDEVDQVIGDILVVASIVVPSRIDMVNFRFRIRWQVHWMHCFPFFEPSLQLV